MRKLLLLLSTFAVLGLAGRAYADVPSELKCDATRVIDCFQEEVFLLDGAAMVGTKPIMTCQDKAMMMGTPDPLNCAFDANLATAHMLEVLAGKLGDKQWDQIVVFGIGIALAKNPPGPLFFRNGDDELGEGGVNEVGNLGLGPKVPRDNTKPYVGVIHAGSTKQAGSSTGQYGACGTLPGRPDAEPPTAAQQAGAALCAPGFYSFFDALAQATATQFGPYLAGPAISPNATPVVNYDLTTWPQIKTALVQTMTGGTVPIGSSKIAGVSKPRIWNSFLNTKGSLLGGNTFRNNGNNTFESTKASPFLGVSAPTGATQVLRFQPLDLYLLGFAGSNEVPDMDHFMTAVEPDIYRPVTTTFDGAVGPRMGIRQLVAVRSTKQKTITMADIVAANGGERDPSFQAAKHYLRQLWVAVKKPMPLVDTTETDYDKIINMVLQWRKAWNSYFYTATNYRGRMITTFDGTIDDLPYWEFGNPADDPKSFTTTGNLTIMIPGNEPVPNSSDRKTVMHIDTPGAGNSMHFTGQPVPMRIVGDQKTQSPVNSISIRVMVPPGGAPKGKASATISFDGGPSVKVPGGAAAFIPDGKFRTYSANLSDLTEFTGKTFTGFTFEPSSVPIGGLEVDFIRIGTVAKPQDTDKDCKGHPKPDGFVDSEDNCPLLYNPLQEDGNEDGIGDACEDFDGDGVPNACDNCPLLTNSRQQDADKDGIGDVCDSDTPAGCFLHPNALAGHLPAAPGALAAATLLGMVGLLISRRRRKG